MRRLYLIGAFVAILSAFTSPLSAQLVVTDQLRNYLHEGLESNLGLQLVRSEEQQAVNSASFGNSGYLPTVDLSGSYTLSDYSDVTRVRGASESTTSPDGWNVMDADIDLSWVLFDGFSVRSTYARMKELEAQSRVATRLAVDNFVATFVAGYYNVIRQKSQLEIYDMSVGLSRERLRIVRARYVVGNYSRLDLQQARVDFNADSADYISQLELLGRSRIQMNTLLARDDLTALLPIADTVIVLDETMDYDRLYSSMMANNAELIMAAQDVALSELDYKLILSRNYPTVDLSAGYGYTAYNYRDNSNEFASALGLQAGISVDFTLFDRQRRAARRNASIDRTNAELSRANVELQLSSQFEDLWMSYNNNLSLLRLERTNLTAAKENYEIAMERYMLGDLSGIEMREAQQSLMDAEGRILSATYNTKLCEISLLLISGEISLML